MDFLYSHWHCILPIAIIGIAIFFMREKPQNKDVYKKTEDFVPQSGENENQQEK